MNTLTIGLCLVLHVLIIDCRADEALLKQLLDRVEKLERKDLESTVKLTEMDDKVQFYADLTENLREELTEKGRIIDEMNRRILDFEDIVRKLKTNEQVETTKRRNGKYVEATAKKETTIAPEVNVSSSLHRQGHQSKRNVSSFSYNKKNIDTRMTLPSSRQTVSQGEAVAFHAVNTHGEIAHIGVGQNIHFETVLLNLNNGFHPQHGVFIAPTAGLYIFSTSVLSFSGQTTSLFAADLVKNGAILGRAYGHGDNGYHDRGSVTAVTQIAAGDEVWVRLHCCADDSLYGGYYTTFTGALLSAL
ncbi:uncharacterized protein LOC128549779 [Mercenaria mercenaria]|uniref:uncharacterized protein LOC128549779 n=1 Tax=Mercenaria mercenaria TaxID=6596 RepID=UPI00234E55A1|nr:uncharacterized protein LOC128549779 [Mercenaria mercenaria]